MQIEAFPSYTQIKSRLPKAFWWFLRAVILLLTLFIIYLLLFQPDIGLVVFWALLIPLLPLVFAVMPGLWRNICPMALLNQLPREMGLSRENTLSDSGRKIALYLSVLAFIVFVLLRHPLLNNNGFYLGLILLTALGLALIGGIVFKGRSGWCGTFCPLAPIQKAYGHAPLLLVKNGYCEPCVGCQKNCYDFNPRAAIFSDLNDSDDWWSDQRKFFIALLPGLIAGFFNSSYHSEVMLSEYLLSMFIPLGLSTGLFYTLHNLLQINFYKLASLFSMSALAIFYWYGTPVLASGIQQILSVTLSEQWVSIVQYSVPLVCLAVVVRGLISERQFKQTQQNSSQASLGEGVSALKAALSQTGQLVSVKEQSSGMQLLMRPGQSLLDALEEADLPIMPGCRMGMCGSDPVVVTDGIDNLDPPDENELNTLRRLGLEGKARLACCCKPKAGISIDLEADPARQTFEPDKEGNESELLDNRMQIIIVGNGIAGISTAESIRKQDSDCRIILITQESYHFYNRMGLEKVLYGRTAMQGLYLMKKEWYERNKIDFWLNTQVLRIDSKEKSIKLGTGESVNYDKLVLATGAKAFVPEQQGYSLPGVFTLRSAEDALSIRSWVQQYQANRAIVVGGGVLGIEAAEALLQLGLKISLVHTDAYLMNRQLDKKSSTILDTFLRNKGIRVFTGNRISTIESSGEMIKVVLQDRKILVTDIILLCIGVRSDVELAKTAGIDINCGIVVDEHMQTSDRDIFCVGDAAELPGAMGGLWSVGSDQGKVAADVLLGGNKIYHVQNLPAVQLKVNGIDLKSFGSFENDEGVESVYSGTNSSSRWCHVRIKQGRIVAGVFVNSPMAANAAINASKKTDQVLSNQDVLDIVSKDEVNHIS